MVAISNFHLGPLTREAARPQWIRDHPHAPWAAVTAVCLGAFMGQLDASIVTLTYPRLQSEFATGLGSVAWVSLSCLVVLAVLLVPVGRWADARGRKLLYLYGFGLFSLASAGCALSPTLGWLVAGRGIQAVGAALLQANSVALVVLSVPRSRVRTALGFQGAAQALGLALGPTLGGVLVDAYGWRAVFWVNVPVGVVAILAGYVLLPRSRDLNPGRGRVRPAGGRDRVELVGTQRAVWYAPAAGCGGGTVCGGGRDRGPVLARRGTCTGPVGERQPAASRRARCLVGGG